MMDDTFNCNGCGGEYSWEHLDGLYLHGKAEYMPMPNGHFDSAIGQHVRTFCVGCHRVLKSIMLNSDLSEQWDNEDIPQEFLDEAE